jgi:hypothetical protein
MHYWRIDIPYTNIIAMKYSGLLEKKFIHYLLHNINIDRNMMCS